MKHLCQICNDNLYVSVFEPIDSRMYTLICGESALVIDPCVDNDMLNVMKELGICKVTVIPTHEHYDHISGINWMKDNFECHVIANKNCAENMQKPERNFSSMFEIMFIGDEEKLKIVRKMNIGEYSCTADIIFENSYNFRWQEHEVEIISSPGHSQGSVCVVVDKNNVFTGDSFLNGIDVITRIPGGSRKDYENITKPMIEKLCKNKNIFPGHGKTFVCV